MTPVGSGLFRRVPEEVRRRLEVSRASAWEALVEVHAHHALRFVSLLASRFPFDEAVRRYLEEMDLREPMASSVRVRVLVALHDAQDGAPSRPRVVSDNGGEESTGLGRFRPDALMKGMARRHRENEEVDQLVALSMAQAEEGVLRTHIDGAVELAQILGDRIGFEDAVKEYIDLLEITGGRAQAVFQRTMARLADLHLPSDGADPGSA